MAAGSIASIRKLDKNTQVKVSSSRQVFFVLTELTQKDFGIKQQNTLKGVSEKESRRLVIRRPIDSFPFIQKRRNLWFYQVYSMSI